MSKVNDALGYWKQPVEDKQEVKNRSLAKHVWAWDEVFERNV